MATKEEKSYTEWVDDHCRRVLEAYYKYGKQILEIMGNKSLETELLQRCMNHDKSKFEPIEFEGYRMHYNPMKGEEKMDADKAFDQAWLHHENFNDHHPEYWIQRDVNEERKDDGTPVMIIYRAIEMSRIAHAEMFCDWIAVGGKFKSTPADWMKKQDVYYQKIMQKDTYALTLKIIDKIWGLKK